MRKFYTGLLMVAVATASFALGRATSGYAPSATHAGGGTASIKGLQAQSVSRNPSHIEPDAPTLSFHGYLIFPPE